MRALRFACIAFVVAGLICGCGAPTLAGEWKTDRLVPGLSLDMNDDGTYTGTLYRSGPQNVAIAGSYTTEGDMIKLTMSEAQIGGAGRQLVGTLATDKRTFTLDGFGVVRKQ